MSPAEIEQLIARVALGDRQAFNALYQATSPKLFAVTMRILGNRSEAEDALQEVYVKVWNRASSFAPNIANRGYSPVGWLVSIARNQSIDLMRQRRGSQVDIEEAFDLADAAPLPEAMTIQKSENREIERCLATLDADRANAVRGAYLDGRSYEELAENYSVPLNTMRTWLRRSLMKLKECLEARL
ncbi:MAG: sigma-70 family RNA polymerase sigma factor [Notoacmeibacter sp.]